MPTTFVRRPYLLAAGTTFSILAIFLSCSSSAALFCDGIFAHVFAGITNRNTWATLHFILEKSVHVTLFLIFGFLSMRVMRASAVWKVCAVVFSSVVVGCAAEYLQTFFPGRDPTIRDVLIDAGGSCIGIALSLVRRTAGSPA